MPDQALDTPRKWRLILNYQDHTILQYEITRKEGGGAEDAASWEARALRNQGVETEDDEGAGRSDSEEGEDDWPLPEAV